MGSLWEGFGTTEMFLLQVDREREENWNPITARIREGAHQISVAWRSSLRYADGRQSQLWFKLKGGQTILLFVDEEEVEVGLARARQMVIRPFKLFVEP